MQSVAAGRAAFHSLSDLDAAPYNRPTRAALIPSSPSAQGSGGSRGLGTTGVESSTLISALSWAHVGGDNMRPLGTVPDDQGNAPRWVGISGQASCSTGDFRGGPLFTETHTQDMSEGRR